MWQAQPYPATTGVQEKVALCFYEAAAQLPARALRKTESSSWCSRCGVCVDSGGQGGHSDQGQDARDSVDEQSCAPRTRVRPSLPLYLAPLGLAARCIFWG
jgi:hypothetical protein